MRSALIATLLLPGKVEANFEVDTVTLQDTFITPDFTAVTFRQTFDRVPVVFLLATTQGGDPSAIRIKDVTTTGFRALQTEPPNNDGPHVAMTNVSYIAIQPGLYEIQPGIFIDAGVRDTTTTIQSSPPFASPGGFDNVEYRQDFASGPAILGDIQTMNNEQNNVPLQPSSPWLTTSVVNQGTNNFDISMERSEVDNGAVVSTNETLGYLALQDTTGSFLDNGSNPIDWEAFISPDVIVGWDEGSTTISYNSTYSSTPIVGASKATRDGPNGGWLRTDGRTATGIGLLIDEDTFNDPERSHTTERASIAVFSEAFDATLTRRNIDITWDGQDASGLWTTNANWERWDGNDRNLQNGDTLVFNDMGSGVTTSYVTQDYTPDLAGITFAGSTAYTINANVTPGGPGSLNFEDGATIVNNSSAAQNLNFDINAKGSTLIIDSGSTPGGSFAFGPDGTIDLSDTGGVNAVFIGSNDTTVESVIAGTGGSVTKTGSGTLTFSGSDSNTYTGATTVSDGTLALDKSGATAIVGDILINGGTLLLAENDQINDSSNMTLDGGTLNTGGNNEVLGTLTLSSNSTIDLNSGGSVLQFDGSGGEIWSGGILLITNWQGDGAGGGSDQILFGNSLAGLTSGQVSQIRFQNPAGFAPGTYGARLLPSGEVVPVPEPAAVAATFGLASLIGWRERKRIAVIIQKIRKR